MFFFNEKIVETGLELKEFKNKSYDSRLIRVVAEFLSQNHILRAINFEFDELDLEIGESIHKLIRDNKSTLSEQILITHNRYFGAVLSKSIRYGYRENENDLVPLTNSFKEIIPEPPYNYFSDVFNRFKQKQNSFDSRFVAFIDILGFKHIVENEPPEKIRSLVSELKSTKPFKFFDVDYNNKVDFQITYFSDCIVLSCKNDCINIKEKVFEYFLLTIKNVQTHFMIMFKCLIRGAVSQGQLVHTKDYCFGPAFNRAYSLESNYTNHPRVLIDLNLVEEFNFEIINSSIIYQGEVFSFLDLVSICFSYLKRKGEWDVDNWNEDIEFYFFKLIELITEGLKLQKGSVRLKYLYLANRFNKLLKELFDEHPNKEFKMSNKYPRINKTLDYIKILELRWAK